MQVDWYDIYCHGNVLSSLKSIQVDLNLKYGEVLSTDKDILPNTNITNGRRRHILIHVLLSENVILFWWTHFEVQYFWKFRSFAYVDEDISLFLEDGTFAELELIFIAMSRILVQIRHGWLCWCVVVEHVCVNISSLFEEIVKLRLH